MNFYDVHWLAVIVAALCGFIIGGLWYGPIMGRKWIGAVGLKEEDLQNVNMPVIYGSAFLFSILASASLDHIFIRFGTFSSYAKILVSISIALTFVIPAIGTNYLFSQKSRALFFIDAGYWLLFYTAMGLVHAWFPS